MRRWFVLTLPVLLLLTGTALAQGVTINGEADDVMYGDPLVVQDTQTGFGDASLGRPDACNGSELDAAYAFIYEGNLHLVLAGNFESNGNKLELFFDTRAGGQNRLLATNPGLPNEKLLRMSDDGTGNGLTFETGFEADFWVSANAFGYPTGVFVDYAELYVDAQNPGVLYFCGAGSPRCTTNGGALTGGDVGAPAILCTVDNANVLGVTGGYGPDSGAGVKTGMELVIPLAAIGNPAGAFNVCAFINGQQHDSVSNQMLGGSNGTLAANPGEPRLVNFSLIAGPQFFTVPAATAPVGACCRGTTCSIETQAACAVGGTYQGDDTNCDGNPCDQIAAGACCFDDGLSGLCYVFTQDDCLGLGGTYKGDGTNCVGCPCLLPATGACCVANTCSVETQAACEGQSGTYVGDFTNCNNNPCEAGACCTGIAACADVRRFECTGNRFFAGVVCSPATCAAPTFTAPYVTGDMAGPWNPAFALMVETPAGSGIWQYTFTVDPNSRHEYKITDGTWSVTRPQSGNAWAYADANGTLLITYDGNYYGDGWLPVRDRLPVEVDPATWTAVGDWEGWNNANPATAMAAQGGGIYKFVTSGLAPATYQYKAVRTGSWDGIGADNRSVNADNISFTVTNSTDRITMWVDALLGRAKLEMSPYPIGDMNCDGAINGQDIDGFILVLFGAPPYDSYYAWPGIVNPPCNAYLGDMNGDGAVNGQDIDGFVAALFGG